MRLAAQSFPTLWDPMVYTLPGSPVYEFFQARILEWGAISYSRGFFQLRDWNWVCCIADRFFTCWAIRDLENNKIFTRTPWSLVVCSPLAHKESNTAEQLMHMHKVFTEVTWNEKEEVGISPSCCFMVCTPSSVSPALSSKFFFPSSELPVFLPRFSHSHSAFLLLP